MSQPIPFLRKLGSTPSASTTATSSSTSSTSSTSSSSTSKPFRAAYTLDNCGHELSYRPSAPKKRRASKKPKTTFSRAAYTLDSQGHDLASKYPYAALEADGPRSYDWSAPQQNFRSLYTLDWKLCSFFN